MSHASNSYSTVLADLTAAVTATTNADFATPLFLGTNTPGIAVAGVGGVVQGILPDTILVSTGLGAAIDVRLPKIGTQACPVGSTCHIRHLDAGAFLVTLFASLVGGQDLIDGAATNVAALPAGSIQTVMIRACSINLTTNVGQWRTVCSSLPNI